MTVSGTPEPSAPIAPAAPVAPPGRASRLSGGAIVAIVAGFVIAIGAIGVAVGSQQQSSAPPRGTNPPASSPASNGRAPTSDSSHISIGNGLVVVPIPSGWSVMKSNSPNGLWLRDDPNAADINIGVARNGTDAPATTARLIESLRSQPEVSQFTSQALADLQLPSSIISQSSVGFTSAIGSGDSAGFLSGAVYAFERTDGWILEAQFEVGGIDADSVQQRFAAATPAWGATFGAAMQRFTAS